MAKYRKKPVVVEAVQWKWHNGPEIEEFMGWPYGSAPDILILETREGLMYVSYGDWIIKGVNGEFYPCKPDIFEKTYERVEEDA